MKEDQGLINYLTNIILRPHRQVYDIQKLGSPKIVVKSHEKSISVLESMSKYQKQFTKQIQKNYCELIEVNRRQVTIRNDNKTIQASIYQPQLTANQKKSLQIKLTLENQIEMNEKLCFPLQNITKSQLSYENCVIFLHANSGSRIEGTEYAKYVLQYRIMCASFDYTGSGISEGQYTTMGVNESKDLSAVINYIANKYHVKKFSLWGRSMGAVTSIYYLITKYKEDAKKIKVKSCIIDSPFSSLQKLILQLASKRSNLPCFVFQPFLNIIQNDIISKIGVNIFTELNLVEKIKSLSPEDKKLLNSVSFLGLASKDDKMISSEHCQKLCQLLISPNVRSSDLIDDINIVTNNSNDKHLMMLIEFKKQINKKGDFIQIEGDHNKPRSNEVKQKISFFIEENFIRDKDQLILINKVSTDTITKEPFKPINFSKTGLNIKTKFSFTKGVNSCIKVRKDSGSEQTIKQSKVEEPVTGHNYNLINLKQIKAKQKGKKSLSKEKESIRNSLNKNVLLKEKKHQKNVSIQSGGKGLNIVSKQFNKDRIKVREEIEVNPKKSIDEIKNSTSYFCSTDIQRSPGQSIFTTFLKRQKEGEQTPRQKQTSLSFECPENISMRAQNSASVNNSMKKTNSQDNEKQSQIIVSSLEFTQNDVLNYNLNNKTIKNNSIDSSFNPHLTHRLLRQQKHFETIPTPRYNRNTQSQTEIQQKKIEQSIGGISTSPFDMSMDKTSSNMSFEMHDSLQEESFRKKQPSKNLDVVNLSFKKKVPKTPQVKISISQFKSKYEKDPNNKSANKNFKLQQYQQKVNKKQNIFGKANYSTNWSFNMNQLKGLESVCSQEKLSSKNSFQFKKHELGRPAETNTIYNSDLSKEESIEFGQNKPQNNSSQLSSNNLSSRQSFNHVQTHTSSNKYRQQYPVNPVDASNNYLSIKKMMINNGHKGLTQSSTFNGYSHHQVSFYQTQYPQQYTYQAQQFSHTHDNQFIPTSSEKLLGSTAYYSIEPSITEQGSNKDLKSSQDQYIKGYPTGNLHSGDNFSEQQNVFLQPRTQMNSQTFIKNMSENSNIKGSTSYPQQNPYQPPKQVIEYKKKITRLLD